MWFYSKLYTTMSSVRVARRFSQLLSLNYNEHEDNPLVQLNAGKKVGILRAQKYQFFRCFPGGKRVSKKGKRDPLDSSKLTHMIIRNNNLRSSTLKMLHSFGCCQIGNHRQNSIDNLKDDWIPKYSKLSCRNNPLSR